MFNELAANRQLGMVFDYVAAYPYIAKAVIAGLIFMVFWQIRRLFTDYIFNYILRFVNADPATETPLVYSLKKPLQSMFVLIGVYLALSYCLPATFNNFLTNSFRSGLALIAAGTIYALVDCFASSTRDAYQVFSYRIDKILVPFIARVIQVIVLSLAFMTVASVWGYDVNGFIAGLGLGGLAFALASKDLLANVFSGVVIIIGKPFGIGDWIKTSTVEGMIEDIGFRSTRIRAFDQALITVPNSNLTNEAITNFTKRTRRQVSFRLQVLYNTPRYNLEACINDIDQMLNAHEGIDPEMIFVKFDAFGSSSLEIFVYFFTKTIKWSEYLSVRQEINLKILAILEANKVQLALPSNTVYLAESTAINNRQ